MTSLKQKMILIMIVCTSSPIYCVSDWYHKKTRKFLTYLGVADTPNIPIKSIDDSSGNLRMLSGGCNGAGIWINEGELSLESESRRLYVLAHEVAHYACNHTRSASYAYYLVKFTEWCALAAGFSILLYYGNRDILTKFDNKILCYCIMGGSFAHAALLFKKIPFARALYYKYTRSLEKEADIVAASMLCTHGYTSVVEDEIERLNVLIAHQVPLGEKHDLHPSALEKMTYLQDVLDRYSMP